jgi:hypothetical protein
MKEKTTFPGDSRTGSSRWAALAEKIRRESQSLGEDREVFDRDRKEFRESFRFRHDGRAAAIDALLQLRREQTPLSDEETSRAREADRP